METKMPPVSVCCKDCDSKKMIPVISKYLDVICPKCGKVLYSSGLSMIEAGKLIQQENKRKKQEDDNSYRFEHFDLNVRAYFPSANIITSNNGNVKAVCFIKYTNKALTNYFRIYLVCTRNGLWVKPRINSLQCVEVEDLVKWLQEKNRNLNVKAE